MTYRHRKIGLLVALLVALAGLVIARPTPSSAAETCNYNILLNGYKEVAGPYYPINNVYGYDYSTGISVWLRKSDRAKMIVIAKYLSNGKSAFLGTATDTKNLLGSNLGSTRGILAGDAWCSTLTKAAYITGRVSYRLGNAGYAQAVSWGP